MAALGCLVLSACGTQQAASDRAAPAGSAVKATTSPKAPQSAEDQEVRFIGLVGQAIDACSPDAPSDKGDKGGEGVPVPEGLVLEEEPTPRYGPGETPPAVPGDAEEAPVPLPSDAPEPPSPATGSAKPKPPAEVPLPGTEKCYGDWHADRVVEAFKNTKATGYDAMRTKLTALDYPAARVHRMPDHGGPVPGSGRSALHGRSRRPGGHRHRQRGDRGGVRGSGDGGREAHRREAETAPRHHHVRRGLTVNDGRRRGGVRCTRASRRAPSRCRRAAHAIPARASSASSKRRSWKSVQRVYIRLARTHARMCPVRAAMPPAPPTLLDAAGRGLPAGDHLPWDVVN